VLQQTLSRSVFAELASPLLFLSLQLLTYPLLQWLSSMLLIDAYAFLADRLTTDSSHFTELSDAYARYSSLGHNAVPGSLLDVRSVETHRCARDALRWHTGRPGRGQPTPPASDEGLWEAGMARTPRDCEGASAAWAFLHAVRGRTTALPSFLPSV